MATKKKQSRDLAPYRRIGEQIREANDAALTRVRRIGSVTELHLENIEQLKADAMALLCELGQLDAFRVALTKHSVDSYRAALRQLTSKGAA